MNNYIIDFYNFISAQMEVPQPYGEFHLISFGLTIVFAILLCVLFRNCSDRTMRILLFISWLVLVIFEVLDQMVIGTTVLPNGTLYFDTDWYRFPFQLCSSVVWILPFIILIPEGKIRDGLIGYMTLFSFIGGLLVMFYPTTIFTRHLVVSLHSVVHHGFQIALGIFFISHERHKYNLRYFTGGVLTFIGLLSIACLLNEVVQQVLWAYGQEDVFNMFYISPYHGCELPILSEIFKLVPYPVFLLIYCLGFILLAFIVYFVATLVNHVVDYVRHREKYITIEDKR